MQWKVIREADSDLATLRVGIRGEADFQELTLAMSDWVRVAESIADLNRPGSGTRAKPADIRYCRAARGQSCRGGRAD